MLRELPFPLLLVICGVWALISAISCSRKKNWEDFVRSMILSLILLGIGSWFSLQTLARYQFVESFGSAITSGEVDEEFFAQGQMSVVKIEEDAEGCCVWISSEATFPDIQAKFDVSRDVAAKYQQMLRDRVDGKAAEALGKAELRARYEDVKVIVPLRRADGMGFEVDGTDFSERVQLDSGIVVPAYVAEEAGLSGEPYNPKDRMILMM